MFERTLLWIATILVIAATIFVLRSKTIGGLWTVPAMVFVFLTGSFIDVLIVQVVEAHIIEVLAELDLNNDQMWSPWELVTERHHQYYKAIQNDTGRNLQPFSGIMATFFAMVFAYGAHYLQQSVAKLASAKMRQSGDLK